VRRPSSPIGRLSIGMFFVGELSIDHFVHVIAGRHRGLLPEVAELLDEGRRPIVQAEQIMHHQYLGVTVDTGSDPDRRNREDLRDLLAEFFGNALENDREGPAASTARASSIT